MNLADSPDWPATAAALREEARPLLERLMDDLGGTLGWRRQIAEQIVGDWAAEGTGYGSETPAEYAMTLAEGIQQWLHDTFVDTTWPACPEHHNHPLWMAHEGDDLVWSCPAGAWSGRLGSLTPPPPGPEGDEEGTWDLPPPLSEP